LQFKHYRFDSLTRFTPIIFIFLLAMKVVGFGQQVKPKTKPASLRKISYAEAQKLLAGEAEGNLSLQPNRFSRTKLTDGRVLEIYYPLSAPSRTRRSKPVTVPGYGVLYESENTFKDSTRARHMLEDLIPDGRELVANLPQLVTRLERRLGAGAGSLDYSRMSLKRIDRYIAGYHSTHTTAQTDPRLFQELTAYYGESLRRALGGEWRMREEKIGGIYVQIEPNIGFNSGGRAKEIKPWSSVITALYDEDSRGTGLSMAFDADLAAARLWSVATDHFYTKWRITSHKYSSIGARGTRQRSLS
jgi:hypothetical protein